MITLVRSGRSYPLELAFLVACTASGVFGLSLGPFVPETATHIGPSWLFYALVLAGGAIGLSGIVLAAWFKVRATRVALWGVQLERAAMLLVGAEWIAYGLAITGVSGLRGAPVAILLAGVGCGCVGRAWQITMDLRRARDQVAATAGPRRPDRSTE